MASLCNKQLKKKSVPVILQGRSGEGWLELLGVRAVCIHGGGSASASSSTSMVCSHCHFGHIYVVYFKYSTI